MRTKVMMVALAIIMTMTGAASALEFSADMVSTSRGNGSLAGKIFVANDKVRMDMMGATTITRMDKQVAYLIMSQQGMYMEQPFDPQKIAGATEKMPGEVERTMLGADTVNGRPANKYRVVYTAIGEKATVFQWVDTATNIPVKTEAENGSWSVEYKNLNVGAQPASLFEIPQGLKKFSVPNMADMAKAMQGAGSGD